MASEFGVVSWIYSMTLFRYRRLFFSWAQYTTTHTQTPLLSHFVVKNRSIGDSFYFTFCRGKSKLPDFRSPNSSDKHLNDDFTNAFYEFAQ